MQSALDCVDATKVHTRTPDEHHWRDLKVLGWYLAKGVPPKAPDSDWCIKAQQISYAADICSAEELCHLFWATGVRLQTQQALELVMIADGADWIWNLIATHFPKAIQILDWFTCRVRQYLVMRSNISCPWHKPFLPPSKTSKIEWTR